MCVCVHMRTHQNACRSQRTIWGSLFSPSTTRVLEIEFVSSSLTASVSIHWALALSLNLILKEQLSLLLDLTTASLIYSVVIATRVGWGHDFSIMFLVNVTGFIRVEGITPWHSMCLARLRLWVQSQNQRGENKQQWQKQPHCSNAMHAYGAIRYNGRMKAFLFVCVVFYKVNAWTLNGRGKRSWEEMMAPWLKLLPCKQQACEQLKSSGFIWMPRVCAAAHLQFWCSEGS